MKSIELLRALTPSELSELESTIKNQKRKSLQQLYSALKKYLKRDGIPTNEELFEKAYSEKYVSEKNYLLRNELRLFNELIYDLLIENTFANYLKKHKSTYYYWLSRSFFERKMKDAFEADIDRFIGYSKEGIKPEDTSLMLDLKSLWMISNNPKTPENLRQQAIVTQQWQQELTRHFKYRLREVESRLAYITNTQGNIEGWEERPEDFRTPAITEIDISPSDDVFENYLILKKHSYQSKRMTRIEILKQMLAIEESKKHNGEYTPFQAQISSLNAIAMELILLGEFAKADEYMLEAIGRCEANKQPIASNNLQNYIANQLNQGEYSRGIEFYNRYEKAISNTRQKTSIQIYKAYSHLFVHQAEEALASLPKEDELTEHQKLMLRMVYVIAFIIRKDYTLAANESRNVARMIKSNTGERFRIYEWINHLLQEYIDALTKTRNERSKNLSLLLDSINADERYAQLVITEFALRWLAENIKDNIGR